MLRLEKKLAFFISKETSLTAQNWPKCLLTFLMVTWLPFTKRPFGESTDKDSTVKTHLLRNQFTIHEIGFSKFSVGDRVLSRKDLVEAVREPDSVN
jgi:hypothetical protein